jgi:hypothetical protein
LRPSSASPPLERSSKEKIPDTVESVIVINRDTFHRWNGVMRVGRRLIAVGTVNALLTAARLISGRFVSVLPVGGRVVSGPDRLPQQLKPARTLRQIHLGP